MLDKKPPVAFISGGKVYRKDDDSTHLPMFHQIEGIYVDEKCKFCKPQRCDLSNNPLPIWQGCED